MLQLGREEPTSRQAGKSLLLRRKIATIFCKKIAGRLSAIPCGQWSYSSQSASPLVSCIMTGKNAIVFCKSPRPLSVTIDFVGVFHRKKFTQKRH
jgi:hypothetical protein